jgi:anti-anti-sigma factor
VTGRGASHGNSMGSYHYAAAHDVWQWSDRVYAIHGFRRAEVVPTTALLLAHAHSADRRRAARLLEDCMRDGEMFSFFYRIVDAGGELRWALIAGEGTLAAGGAVTGMRGYLIDVTEPQARARSQEVASASRKAIASRATIEQAKGALMLVYGLDAEAAFALLSWQSQHSNIKLRDLADRLVTAVGGDAHASTGIRQRLDEIVYSLPAAPAPASRLVSTQNEDDLLAVQHERRDGAVVLHLSGEVDMATGPCLDKHLADAMTMATPPAPVVIDLTNVQHLGSVGVALLTSYHRRYLASGIPLRIVAGDGPVGGVLAMAPTGLEFHECVSDALVPDGRGDSAARPLPEVMKQDPDHA